MLVYHIRWEKTGMENQAEPSALKIFLTRSEEETFEAAETLAQDFKGDEVLLLTGPLGAGKTVFARGIAAGLGIGDVTEVCSPSYVLINVYQARFPIYHIDLYRLQDEEEIEDLGWEDFLGRGVVIVEWAEKLQMDIEVIHVVIDLNEDETRKITIQIQPG